MEGRRVLTPQRPVGTGSLLISGQEAVPDIEMGFCYSLGALVFDNKTTAKCVAHHPV